MENYYLLKGGFFFFFFLGGGGGGEDFTDRKRVKAGIRSGYVILER